MSWQATPLAQSTAFGFLDRSVQSSNEIFNPSLIANQPDHTMLMAIRQELRRCNHFTFSVAFITTSALAMLKQELLDYEGTGTFITSTYLDFNAPEAFEELLGLERFKVLVHDDPITGFHAKGYAFHHDDGITAIVGSSNLTDRALNSNEEWNLKFSAFPDGDIALQIAEATRSQIERAKPVTPEWIREYEAKRKIRKLVSAPRSGDLLPEDGEIVPNPMQAEALEGLFTLIKEGEKRALIISATGTGKTILAALAARAFAPKRLLFVVHREQILTKAMQEFQRVFGASPSQFGRVVASDFEIDKRFVFATIQSISRKETLEAIPKDQFDYIIVDEVHRSGAPSYTRVIDHFTPDFLLGLTATPERSDDFNIYELFHYNVPYEIRLKAALEAEMLVPFHYYGVSDFVDSKNRIVDDSSKLAQLVAPERVKYILEMIKTYGHTRGTKGLIFCRNQEEARTLSELFNERELYGKQLRTVALFGSTPQNERESAVRKLEAGELDYLFTIDIFNEGIDIPAVNQIVMLRSTQSSIIFTQQLGRGLRKFTNKDHLRVIDFIGNYKNNYLIPVALFGDRSRNPETTRKKVNDGDGDNTIAKVSSVNFDKVAKSRVLDSLEKAKMNHFANLSKDVKQLANMLGRTPKLIDFATRDLTDPVLLATNQGNYWRFLNKAKFDDRVPTLEENFFLAFFSYELLPGKRAHELLLVKELLQKRRVEVEDFVETLLRMDVNADSRTISGVEKVLTLDFFRSKSNNTILKKKLYGELPIIRFDGSVYTLSEQFEDRYDDATSPFSDYVDDVIETGLWLSRHQESWSGDFKVGHRYTRLDVCKLLNFDNNQESTIYGYKADISTRTCPIFVTYHKSDDISAATKYEDELLDTSTMRWYSRHGVKMDKPEMQRILVEGYDIHVFVKKSDTEGKDFYYLGQAHPKNPVAETIRSDNNKDLDIVRMDLEFENPIPENLFNYLNMNLEKIPE